MLPTPNIANPNVYPLQDEDNQKVQPRKVLSQKKKNDILAECKKNIGRWYGFFSDNIRQFRQDKDFFRGVQWSNFEGGTYLQLGKIPYTINKLKPLVRQLVGEQMSMQPKLNLVSTDADLSNPNDAIMMTKFLRALAYGSHASKAYSDAFKNQLVGGWGVIKVGTEYESAYKFDQCIKIEALEDPLTVGFDPASQMPSKTDGDFQFQYEIMNKDDFHATWPNAEVPTTGQYFGEIRDFLPQIDDKSVIVLDYYVKEYKSKTLLQLSNNINFKIEILAEDLEEVQSEYALMMQQQGVPSKMVPLLEETNRRKTKLTFVHCYKCTTLDVIEHYEWPAEKLPFVFVDGFSTFQDGKQRSESFIYGARDAQKTYNYCISEAVNGLSRLRREKVWMTRKQADGQEPWLNYPDRQQSYGEYTPDPEAPQGPIFRPPEELAQAFFNLAEVAEQDIYKTLGVYPANRGELPNQTSGVAIGRTITQANLAFAQLLQNLYNGMQIVGEIVLELIPKIYDAERVVSVLDEAGKTSAMPINQVVNNAIQNDVTKSVYRLEVQPVASFAIQQEMINEQLYKLASLSPAIPNLIVDMIASTIQSPIAPRLVERLRTLVPPNIVAQEEGQPVPPPPPPSPVDQLQMAMAQAKIKETNANADKLQADVLMAQAKMGITARQSHNDEIQSEIKNQLELQKLAAARDETIAATEKSSIDADAEITKAQIQGHAQTMTALANLRKAELDANSQLSKTKVSPPER